MKLLRKKLLSLLGDCKALVLLALTISAVISVSIREINESFHESLCHSMQSKVFDSSIALSSDLKDSNNEQQDIPGNCLECRFTHSCRSCSCFAAFGNIPQKLQLPCWKEAVFSAGQKIALSNFFSRLFRPPIA